MAKRKPSAPRVPKVRPGAVGTKGIGEVRCEVIATLSTQISLRDWFAGQALCASLLCMFSPKTCLDREILATEVYALADAMLLARDKGIKKGTQK